MKIKTKNTQKITRKVELGKGTRFRLNVAGGVWEYIFGTPDGEHRGLINIETGQNYTHSSKGLTDLTINTVVSFMGSDWRDFAFFDKDGGGYWVSMGQLKYNNCEWELEETKEVETEIEVPIGIGTFIEKGEEKFIIAEGDDLRTVFLINLKNGVCRGTSRLGDFNRVSDFDNMTTKEIEQLFSWFATKNDIKFYYQGKYYPLIF